MRKTTLPTPYLVALILIGLSSACAASSHPTQIGKLGADLPVGSPVAELATPGPITLETLTVAHWQVERSGLINLEHPKAVDAGLEDGDEPIAIFMHVIRHPEFGTYVVDSGVSKEFNQEGGSPRLSWLVASAMNLEHLDVKLTTADFIAAEGGVLDGVFLTHMHLDHIMGIPDLPASTPIYTGPGEASASRMLNMAVQGTVDRLFEDRAPINEWKMSPDPTGTFEGVVDVFGDGSLLALHTPGHTVGSTCYLVRTTGGPVLLVGDVAHTRWGWDHGVEPGSFNDAPEEATATFLAVHRFAVAHPEVEVRLGHQE